MNIINTIVATVGTGAVTTVAYYLVALLKRHLSAKNFEILASVVKQGVALAEQLYDSPEAKRAGTLAYTQKVLSNLSVDFKNGEIESQIEVAVHDLKTGLEAGAKQALTDTLSNLTETNSEVE